MEKLVPKLRFPEFKGNWEEKILGDITSWASGGTPPKDNPIYWYGDIPWISASSMRGIEYSDSEIKITNEGLKKGSKLAKKGALLILVRGSMLFNKIPIGITLKDVAFNQDVKSIVVNDSSISKYILQWFIASETRILNMVTGTGIGAGKIDLQDLKSLKIEIPSLPEQQKIASFLTSVDERLTLLAQQKEKLELYKKGVMQQIFSQKLRFKDENGNNYPDWDEKKLGEVCKVVVGGTPSTTKPEYWDGNIGWIGSGELKNNIIKKPTKFITELGLKKSSTYLMPKSTVVLAMTGATLGKIGILDFECSGNQSVAGFLPSDNFDNFFLFYLLQDLTKQILSYAGGAAQAGINKKNIETLEINLPCIEEQQKIASFLSAIDVQIEGVSKKIEQTKWFKKGLLQQMFV